MVRQVRREVVQLLVNACIRCVLLISPVAVMGAICAASAVAAPPKVDYLFPAGVTRGEAVTVTAGGKIERWPVDTWFDRQGLTVEPLEENGQLRVAAAEDAAPGLYWIRLYDGEGAASPQPFYVGMLPEVLESEPNDDPQSPQVLDTSSVCVNGQLARGGDVDTFSVPLTAGQTLVARLDAHTALGSPMDAVLQIVSADGFVLEQVDDVRGLDPQIAFTAPSDGRYLVRMFAFPADPNQSISFSGSPQYVYRLTLTTEPWADHALPLVVERDQTTEIELSGWNLADDARRQMVSAGEDVSAAFVALPQPGGALWLDTVSHPSIVEAEPNSADAPQPVEWPVTISGRIEPAGDVDAFRFTGMKDQTFDLRVESRKHGFELDPVLRLSDAEGKLLKEVDDSGGGRDADMTFTLPADGEYVVTVSDLHRGGGLRYVYTLTITEATPDFRLTVAADAFTATAGKSLEIPVAIERRHGLAEEIEIRAEGLPDGVECQPAVSKAEGDSAKSVKLSISAPTAHAGQPFRIVGRVVGESATEHAATAALKVPDATTTDLWLTVIGE